MSATYVAAGSVDEAVKALADGARPVAGGTDLVVGARQGKKPLPDALVAIHRIDALRGISAAGAGLRLGALATHEELESHPVVRERFTGLADASAIVGSRATRANGTIGGNVMNASPAMDTGAPLICLDASVVLQGPGGNRSLPIEELFTGPGQTVASPDELLIAIDLPAPAVGTGSAYVRLEYRRQMEIAIVGAAAAVTVEGGKVTAARIAITALAPTIHRITAAEDALVGTDGGREAAAAAAAAAAAGAAPISDVRGSADYRRAMAAVIARRAIEAAVARAGGADLGIPASSSTYAAV
jgi:CO/xanthine dehydrogenase FAD-binding subunit